MPPVCLLCWVSEVTLGGVLSRRQWSGPLVAQHSGCRSHGGWAEVLLLLRHWSPQKEQLQREGSLCVLGAPPWSFPPPVPGRESWASVLSKSPSALYPPACPPTPVPWPWGGPRMHRPPPIICWKVQRRRGGRFPHGMAPVSLDWLPGTFPQRGHTFCSHPVPFFCIWENCVVINPEMNV